MPRSRHEPPVLVVVVATVGEQAFREGRYPKPVKPSKSQMLATPEPVVVGEGFDPAGVRPAPALTAAQGIEAIRASLLQAATQSERGVWATVDCKFCSKTGRYSISVPDERSRVAAVEVLLREGLCWPAQAEDASQPKIPQALAEVRSLKHADAGEAGRHAVRRRGAGTALR